MACATGSFLVVTGVIALLAVGATDALLPSPLGTDKVENDTANDQKKNGDQNKVDHLTGSTRPSSVSKDQKDDRPYHDQNGGKSRKCCAHIQRFGG